MLKNNKLLIDKDCPMCRIYGNCFSQMKLVDEQTIIHYQTAREDVFALIDKQRAKSEIALHDTDSGETVYGADAFMKILAGNNRLLKRIFSCSGIRFAGRKLYRFVSFNRHVITGPPKTTGQRDCVPEVHQMYRWLYIILTAIFTGFMVNHFALALDLKLGLAHSPWREYLICFGQVTWQFLVLSIISQKRRLDYLGNMSTVSLIGAFMLIPLLALNALFDLSVSGLLGGFFLIVASMFSIHVRRSKRLKLPFLVSVSWVLYRTVVLFLILLFVSL